MRRPFFTNLKRFQMKQYQVTAICNLNSGLVELDQDQARRRKHNIKHVKDNVYGIVNPIQFKAGEKLGHDGDVNKALLSCLSPPDDDAPNNVSDDMSDDEYYDSYDSLTKKELVAELDARDVKHASNLNKPKLIELLEANDNDAQDTDNE